ncbi:MAG TPA: hypothetical protein VN663_14230 [Ramlibacter sp.]|jgi:hypothetical protein|nr:hypothetical protein [Ramlibacter sp.]
MSIGSLSIPDYEFSTKLPDVPPPDQRAVQMIAMFLRLDERGKQTALAQMACLVRLCGK